MKNVICNEAHLTRDLAAAPEVAEGPRATLRRKQSIPHPAALAADLSLYP